MKKIISFLILLNLGFAQSFEDYYKAQINAYESYKKETLEDYKKYLEELNKEFREYKKIYLEEFENYKREISKYWDKPEVLTKRKWVEYSNDLKTKKVVDFKHQEIRVEVISNSRKEAEEKLKKALSEIVTEKKDQAFKNNKFLSKLERKVTKLKHVKKAKLEKEPLVEDLIFKKSPSKKEIKKFVEKVVKNHVKVKKEKNGKKIYVITYNFPFKGLLRKALRYKGKVIVFSKKYKLSPALVYAIIHTESTFNPLAQSPIPAYGLMQIVPQTAGKDATKIIYGKPVLLSPSYLFNGHNNIMVGSTYLYLLYYRYFGKIKNPLNRLYVTIAAYNTGIGNVAKAVCGSYNLKKAIKVINSLSSEELYKILQEKLPLETKNYLKRVLKRKSIYERFFNKIYTLKD